MCEQDRKPIQIRVNAIPIRLNFLLIERENNYPDTCEQALSINIACLIPYQMSSCDKPCSPGAWVLGYWRADSSYYFSTVELLIENEGKT